MLEEWRCNPTDNHRKSAINHHQQDDCLASESVLLELAILTIQDALQITWLNDPMPQSIETGPTSWPVETGDFHADGLVSIAEQEVRALGRIGLAKRQRAKK